MSQPVFVSLLGASDYAEVAYGLTECDKAFEVQGESKPTKFIQIARLRALMARGLEFDKDNTHVLVTELSKNKNWGNGLRTTTPYVGLKTSLEEIGLKDIEPIAIKDGKSTAELWENFQTIANLISKGDELYVDITHGFRSQSIILMLSLDYVVRAKGAEIVELTYGAYEAKEDEVAPVFDLTGFLGIRDWSTAAALLEQSGDISQFAAMAESASKEVKKQLRRDMPRELKSLASSLQNFGDHLKQCRLHELPLSATRVLDAIAQSRSWVRKTVEYLPLDHILDDVREKIEPLAADPGPSYSAVRGQLNCAAWCFHYENFIVGFTLLRETIGDLIEVWVDKESGLSPEDRGARHLEVEKILGCLAHLAKPEGAKTLRLPKQPWAKEALAWLRAQGSKTEDLIGILGKVTTIRNQLDHGGTGSGKSSRTKKYKDAADETLRNTMGLLDQLVTGQTPVDEHPKKTPKMFLVFSHDLTKQQAEDARDSFGVEEFVVMPEALKERWIQVDPESDSNEDLLHDVFGWIEDHKDHGDIVLVQGEFGATFALVTSLKQEGDTTPVYATTRRSVIEKPDEGGIVRTQRLFEHVRFRAY